MKFCFLAEATAITIAPSSSVLGYQGGRGGREDRQLLTKVTIGGEHFRAGELNVMETHSPDQQTPASLGGEHFYPYSHE